MTDFFDGLGFSFLFRQDQGVVDRKIWWRGTLILGVLLGVLTTIWWMIAAGAHRSLANTAFFDARTAFTYLYLIIYGIVFMLIAICHYNLSAKRFRARGQPTGLAGLLPFAALLTGAINWIQPQINDEMPDWTTFAADGVMALVIVFVIFDLGIAAVEKARS